MRIPERGATGRVSWASALSSDLQGKPHRPDMLRIALRGGFRIDQLERLIQAVAPLSSLSQPTRLVLDLSGLVFISPASLATLLVVVADAIERGVILSESEYGPPANRLVARYLDRMDFNRLITGMDVEGGFERRQPTGLRPFQVFDSQEDLDDLAESLTMAATEAVAVTGKDRAAVLLAITEIAQNVLQHAESRIGGIAIAQRGWMRQEFEVAVADPGIGIAASLQRNRKYQHVQSDVEAILLALAPGVTANPGSENKGVGLAAIRGFLRENGGTLLVRSGCAAIEDGSGAARHDGLARFRGTVVALRLRIGHPFEFALFSELAASLTRSRPILKDLPQPPAISGKN
jgi:anti-sigma regulatory factor (Ser/Thr protein kinase)